MKSMVLALFCLVAINGFAAKRPDFSGSWEFNAVKSKNVGMMSQAKMTQTIQQTASTLDVVTHSVFQGSDQDMKTHYDLTGNPATNDSPMSGTSETVSKWDGDKVVTSWTSQSAVAGGPKVVSVETRSLSSDGKTMTVESVRGTNPPFVMVFDRK